MNKTQMLTAIQQKNPGLTRHDITGVLESLTEIAIDCLKTEGTVVIPWVAKLKAVEKPATEERQGVNPFTKQPVTIAAKPASKKIKATPAKPIRDALGA